VFLCVGAQHPLDFGDPHNTKSQSFIVIGRVDKGIDIVKKIHQILTVLKVDIRSNIGGTFSDIKHSTYKN
tara:strand:- start:100 stop:309 length:210 start_codon:yes stop_codon:yes gene_type:complete